MPQHAAAILLKARASVRIRRIHKAVAMAPALSSSADSESCTIGAHPAHTGCTSHDAAKEAAFAAVRGILAVGAGPTAGRLSAQQLGGVYLGPAQRRPA